MQNIYQASTLQQQNTKAIITDDEYPRYCFASYVI